MGRLLPELRADSAAPADEELDPGLIWEYVTVAAGVVADDAGRLPPCFAREFFGGEEAEARVAFGIHEDGTQKCVPAFADLGLAGRSPVAFIDPRDQVAKSHGLSWPR